MSLPCIFRKSFFRNRHFRNFLLCHLRMLSKNNEAVLISTGTAPAFNPKLLFVQEKQQSAELRNHQKHASGVLKSAAEAAETFLPPDFVYKRPADRAGRKIMQVHWEQVLEQTRTASVDGIARLLRNLASLHQQFFEKAALMSLQGGEGDKSILVELQEVLLELFLQSSQLSDFAFSANELFAFGNIFTKMNLVRDPLLDWVLSSLTPYLTSFSDQELIAVSFLAHANRQMPKETALGLEEQIQLRSYQLDAVNLALLIHPFNCCQVYFENRLTDDIVAEKTIAVLNEVFTPPGLPHSHKTVETFLSLLQNLIMNSQQILRKLNKHDSKFFARQIFDSIMLHSDLETPFEVWSTLLEYFYVAGYVNQRFLSRVVETFLRLDITSMKIKSLGQLLSAFIYSHIKQFDHHQKIFELVEGEIRQRFVAGRLEESPQSNRDLLVIVKCLVLSGHIPKDLVRHVLSEAFYFRSKRSIDGMQNSFHTRELPLALHFLDSCIQFHPQLRSRLPRCPHSAIQDLKNVEHKLKWENRSDGPRSGTAHEVYSSLFAVMDVEGYLVRVGRLLPHFKTDDVVLQYDLDGVPTSFALDSSIRLLDVDQLRLSPERRGVVFIVTTFFDPLEQLLLKKKQLEFLGYDVCLVDITNWKRMGVPQKRMYLQRILEGKLF